MTEYHHSANIDNNMDNTNHQTSLSSYPSIPARGNDIKQENESKHHEYHHHQYIPEYIKNENSSTHFVLNNNAENNINNDDYIHSAASSMTGFVDVGYKPYRQYDIELHHLPSVQNSMKGFVDIAYNNYNNNDKPEILNNISSSPSSFADITDSISDISSISNPTPNDNIPTGPNYTNMFKFVSNVMVLNQSPYIVENNNNHNNHNNHHHHHNIEHHEESQYGALNMMEWSINNDTKSDIDNTRDPILPITSFKKTGVINEKSQYVISPENKNNETKTIPSVLKICASHSNPAEFEAVHINNNEQIANNNKNNIYRKREKKRKRNNNNNKKYIVDDFEGDILSYNTWLTCCNIYDETMVYFDVLFVELLKIWKEKTKCHRVPTEAEIRPIFIRLGGKIINNNICIIKKEKYVKFWKWFKNCYVLINEIKHLWDSFKLNLFCNRKDVELLLNRSCPGTFILRISATMCSSLIISYVQSTTITIDNNQNIIKHVILNRQSPFKFIIHKNNQKQTTLSHLIRSFIKLKYIYCDIDKIYPKNVVF